MITEYHKFESLQYIIKHSEKLDMSEKQPILLSLHGAGTRGNDVTALNSNPLTVLIEKNEDFPFVYIAPQCHENTWFDLWETLERYVKFVASLPFVDTKRIYLMGASMGGYATWQLAMSMPEYFAAIVPICGGGMYWNAGRLVNVPVWAFHGGKDDVVFCDESKKMVDAVNKNGGCAKLTIYPENAHDSWSDTYANPSVFEWLLSYENKNELKLSDVYDNSELYG